MNNRYIIYLASVFAFVLAIMLLKPILMPFVFSALLAYLLDPVVDKLEEKGMSRTAGVGIVFLVLTIVFLTIFLLLVPMLGTQIVTFVQRIPEYIAWVQGLILPHVENATGATGLGVEVDQLQALLADNWQKAGDFFAVVLEHATASTLTLIAWIGNLVLIPVVTFYLLRDWDGIIGWIREALPRHMEAQAVALTGECNEVLSAFIRGQLLVMAALAFVYSTGLAIVGLDLALFIGILAGLASIVPYLGGAVGIVSALVAAYMQFGEWLPLLYVLIVFGVGQVLEGMWLTPVLVGDKIGLHPVAVIFAIMAGGQLAGFVGVLIALPVAAVLMVFLRHLHNRYKESGLYLEEENG